MSETGERLKSLCDGKYASFSRKLGLGKHYPLIGVRLPQLRVIGKQLARRDDWREILADENRLSHSTYEEILLRAFVIGYARMNIAERLQYIAGYVPLVNDWALCDNAVATLRFNDCDYEKVYAFAAELTRSHEEYSIRFGIVLMILRLKRKDRLDGLLEILSKTDTSAFYAMMAVAWACAEFFKLDNRRVIGFLKGRSLDLRTTRKAFSKICDSLTTSDEYRQNINEIRKTLK